MAIATIIGAVAFESTATASTTPASFADGIHRVGTDVAPNTYVANLQDGVCFVSITDVDQEVRNPTFIGRAIITLSERDAVVETSKCGEWTPRGDRVTGGLATQFSEGMYQVGVDIRPGIYRADGNDGRCFWFTISDFDHRPALDNLITWWKVGEPVVEIPRDTVGFYSVRCGTWDERLGESATEPMLEFGDGSYLVGLDIAPGVYAADAGEGMCNWFRTAPFGETEPNNSGGYVSAGRQIARVLSTDAGFYSHGCGTWEPLKQDGSDSQRAETIGTGTVAIGTEVQPGVYFADAINNRLCRWFALRDFAGRPVDIVASGNGVLRAIVELPTNIVGFRSVDCGTWTMVENADRIEAADRFADGEHIVNVHISPGIYSSPGPTAGRCVWRRISGFSGSTSEQIAVRYPVGRNIAEISDKDAIFESFGCGKWEMFTFDNEMQFVESFEHGTWAVNLEIEPGTYVSTVPDGRTCFWSRLSAFTGEPKHFVATDLAVGHLVTTVQHYDAGFYSDGCGTWKLVSEAAGLTSDNSNAEFDDGVYIVGRDVVADTYIASGIEGEICFWSRLTGFDGDPFNRMNTYASDGQAIATILASDTGFRSFGCGTWRHIVERQKTSKFSDGTFEVGVDVEPGTYIATDATHATCRWRRLSDFTGTTGNILETIASGQKIVTIRDTDIGFASFGCGEWNTFVASDAPKIEMLPNRFSSGSYVIGSHIKPGTYYAVPHHGGGCRWSKVKGFTGDPSEVISKGGSDNRWVVTINTNDAGFVTHGCGIWRNVEVALKIGPFSEFYDGVHRVGIDIIPGTYVANVPTQPFIDGQPVRGCRWRTVSEFGHTVADVTATGGGRGRVEVTLTDSDIGFVSDGCGEWRKRDSQQ